MANVFFVRGAFDLHKIGINTENAEKTYLLEDSQKRKDLVSQIGLFVTRACGGCLVLEDANSWSQLLGEPISAANLDLTVSSFRKFLDILNFSCKLSEWESDLSLSSAERPLQKALLKTPLKWGELLYKEDVTEGSMPIKEMAELHQKVASLLTDPYKS